MTKLNNGVAHTMQQRVTVLQQGNYLLSQMTTIRSSETTNAAFCNAFEQVASQLITTALDFVPIESVEVVTPTGRTFRGARQVKPVCGVSILRAGASFEHVLRKAYDGPLSFGKVLIQRDEKTSLPTYLYSNLPKNITSSTVLVLEPMLATGGSSSKAIEILKEAGVCEENMIFVNLLAAKKGVNEVLSRFPGLRLVTAAVDDELTASNHIAPGLGDFGDRFYGTTA
ncbi:uracil phosphoribosyltransferase-domain-containing protein [Hypoxylon crocopeplum]|nr:uracil phosphoribosyltransferase-domain-containing protein [Hypoxylon crocopeplum]